MKTVILFGAGASRSAGAPLMADFLDRADLLGRGMKASDTKAAFDLVFSALSRLQPVFAKSHLDCDNIETFFGAVEMGGLLSKFPGGSSEVPAGLRDALVRLIVCTLEESIGFDRNSEGLVAPEPWETIGGHLQTLLRERLVVPADVTLMTFNYDILLDYTLTTYGVPFDYGLEGSPSADKVALLKLHGSINWAHCGQCKVIVPLSLVPWISSRTSGSRRTIIDVGTQVSRSNHKECSYVYDSTPLLVPPTWNKTPHHPQVVNVWRAAARRLGTAENIALVGYSLPETDSFFRYLFALGTQSDTRIKQILVVNPDTNEKDVQRRIRGLMGGNVAHRLFFMDGESGRFENSWKQVLGLLMS